MKPETHMNMAYVTKWHGKGAIMDEEVMREYTAKQFKRLSLKARLTSGAGQITNTELDISHPHQTMIDAADRITSLESENRRLRQALAKIGVTVKGALTGAETGTQGEGGE